MKLGDKLSHEELDSIMNSWPEGTLGHGTESGMIATLDRMGAAIGYGALSQLAQWLYDIQCHGKPKPVADFKRERFKAMNWPLPADFEEVAKK